MGGVLDTSNSSFNPGFVRPIEADVALCRACGERMNFVKKREIMETPQEFLAAKEKLEKDKKKFYFGLVFWIFWAIVMVVIFSS